MQRRSRTDRLRAFVYAHERRLMAAYVCVAAALVLLAGADAVKLGLGDRALRAWNERWTHRVEAAEELLRKGRHDAAIERLEALDEDLPARHVKHALWRERLRVQTALGDAYQQTGRRRRARETFTSLVEFDPRNYASHAALASCLLEQGRQDEALAPLGAALTIHPSHRPSAEALVEVHFEAGRYRDAVAAWSDYLDAVTYAEVVFDFGGAAVTLPVAVDGRFHTVEVAVPASAAPAQGMSLQTGGPAVEVGEGAAWGALVVGRIAAGERMRSLPPAAWTPSEMTPVGAGRYRPSGEDALLRAEAPGGGFVRVRVALRLLKPCGAETRQLVAKSLRNLRAAERPALDLDRALVVDGDE